MKSPETNGEEEKRVIDICSSSGEKSMTHALIMYLAMCMEFQGGGGGTEESSPLNIELPPYHHFNRSCLLLTIFSN